VVSAPGSSGGPAGFPTVTIPQVLTAALGAAVYTCLAQRIGANLVDSSLKGLGPFDIPVIAAIFLWNTKNLVDDYKAFDHKPDPEFNLWWTLTFSAAAYTTLAVAASSLFKGQAAVWILMIYFGILSLWSLVSFVRRTFSSKRDKNDTDKESRRRRRGIWILMYAVCGAGIFASLQYQKLCTFIVFVGVIYFIDCIYCSTFSIENKRQI
jgi:hypothetical protein